jgi:GT2 family glycosyltransferase
MTQRPIVTRSAAPIATVPEPGGPADVSFVFVTFGTGPVVVDAIASVVESLDATAHAYEVIVVDNEHPDALRRSRNELALSTSGVRIVVPGRNLGFGAGCELGALHAGGRILAFVNPDVVLRSGWLAPLLAHLEQGASIVAPVFVDPDGKVQEAGSVLYADGSTGPITEPPAPGRPRHDYASAACWLVHRDEHERIGGFDPDFHPAYYEDVDLVLRAARLGAGIEVVRESTVVHRRGTGTFDGPIQRDTTDQRDALLARHPEVRWRQAARPGALR